MSMSMTAALSIFDFQEYHNFLTALRNSTLAANKRPMTYLKWARRLGYRSPRIVSMVFKGQRFPSSDMIDRISRTLALTKTERSYLALLVQLEKRRRRGADARENLDGIEAANPRFIGKSVLDGKAFSYVADWYHFVIRQLIGTPGFREDPQWIRRKLRGKVTELEVRSAIRCMLDLKLIRRNPRTGRLELGDQGLDTAREVPNTAARLHQRQMLERATEALEEQPLERRAFNTLTLRFDESRIAEAKQMIHQFKKSFDKRFYRESGNVVYQLNIQLFEHTASVKGPSREK